MGTKRILTLSLALAILLGGMVYLRKRGTGDGAPLRFLTWSNYFPESLLKEFTEKTGVRVELSYMSSNEELFAKLRAGATGFDLIQPSDYMVRRLSKLNMLAPINHNALANLSNLDEAYRNLPFDPGLVHSVPFTFGTTGIALNVAKVKIPEGGVSWKMVYDSPDPRHTSLLDDMREVFAGVFTWKGLSINSTSPADLALARGEISKARTKILTFSSEPRPLMLKDEITIAQCFSVDGNQAHKEQPDIQYFIPKEGGTIWTDNFAIPVAGQKKDAAHAFIDFFLQPENAVRLMRENSVAMPNKAAQALLSEAERNDPGNFPNEETMKRLHFLEDIGDTLNDMNKLWTELKSEST